MTSETPAPARATSGPKAVGFAPHPNRTINLPRQRYELPTTHANRLRVLWRDPAIPEAVRQAQLDDFWTERGKAMGFVWETVLYDLGAQPHGPLEFQARSRSIFISGNTIINLRQDDAKTSIVEEAEAWLGTAYPDADALQGYNRSTTLAAYAAGRAHGVAIGQAPGVAEYRYAWRKAEENYARATALLLEASGLFREYEESHDRKADEAERRPKRDQADEDAALKCVGERRHRAARNRDMAARIEALVYGERAPERASSAPAEVDPDDETSAAVERTVIAAVDGGLLPASLLARVAG